VGLFIAKGVESSPITLWRVSLCPYLVLITRVICGVWCVFGVLSWKFRIAICGVVSGLVMLTESDAPTSA